MRNLREMLKQGDNDAIWKAYLGFLDLSIDEFMSIQERLLLEQINLLSHSKLGQQFLRGNKIKSIDEFRKLVPLTTYEDYADTLLNKRSEDLPSEPLHWVQTTWKGGSNPIKLAPYSKTMVEENTKMFLSSLILSTSKKRGHFNLRNHDKFLYGMAPRPYLTGYAPYILKHEIDFEYLPSTEAAEKLGFRERNQVGFELAVKKGADLFYGVSSVLVKIGESFAEGGNSKRTFYIPSNGKQAIKMIRALYKKKFKKQKLLPKDLFEFKGIVCGGTDSETYKSQIEHYFGITPLEIFGGTESAGVATETWSRNGMTFFPDVNFLEFIPEVELKKEEELEEYQPKTVLYNEIQPGEIYELVITKLRGGAFVRYRIGDILKCTALRNEEDQIELPQIKYLDRVSNIIDLAGFTRLTKQIINDALKLSGLPIVNFLAGKEYGENQPYIRLYLELSDPVIKTELHSKITDFLRRLDQDYSDIHTMLGYDPLRITILNPGTFEEYTKINGLRMNNINPTEEEISEIKGISKKIK